MRSYNAVGRVNEPLSQRQRDLPSSEHENIARRRVSARNLASPRAARPPRIQACIPLSRRRRATDKHIDSKPFNMRLVQWWIHRVGMGGDPPVTLTGAEKHF